MSARELRHPFFDTPCEVTINRSTYRIKRKLDNGSFGQVYVAYKSQNKHELVAIKIMSHERIKKKQQQNRINSEINLHSQINLNNIKWTYSNKFGIVSMFDFDYNVIVGDKLYTCMVMEYCEGSHLNQYLRYHPSDRLNEIEAFYFFQQIICSLECLHSQNIIHRDIKPQNLLLSNTQTSLPILKLCDFGLAKKLPETSSTTHSMCGTPNYVAPEIVKAEGHSYSADIWSAGIVLYIMLVKHHQPPFETGNVHKTMAKVRDSNVFIPQYLSKYCQSFLSLIFIKNKSKRINLKQLKKHIWYKQNKKKLNILLRKGLNKINTRNLRNYNKCFNKMGYIYDLNNQESKLLWGGKHNDDYSLHVTKNGQIIIIYGGICTKTYNINTIPIGFYEKYIMLYQFVMIQTRNTPLIAISIGNKKQNYFNTNHYAILVQSQHIDYCHISQMENHNKSEIFMQLNKKTNEYIGYYQKKPFNVLQTKLHQNDVQLFHALKTELLGILTSKYIHNKNKKLKYPITLQYNVKNNTLICDQQSV